MSRVTGILVGVALASCGCAASPLDGYRDWTIGRATSAGQAVRFGDGVPPKGSVDVREGTVTLTSASDAASFPVLSRHFTATGAWFRVSARVRTQQIDGDAIHGCTLLIAIPGGGAIRDPPTFVGTTDWTPFSRTWQVPTGADVTVSVLLDAPGRCDLVELAAGRVDPGWRTESYGAYTYHILPGDDVPDADRGANQAAYDELLAWFALPAGPKVDFWKYPDNATKAEFTGDGGNGHADVPRRAIHSIWSRDRHEIVHLLSTGWGDPPPLLAEGLAVWLSGSWQGEPVAEYARNLGTKWIPLDQIGSRDGFRATDGRVAYAEAGALVGWLLETRGKDATKQVYGALRADAGPSDLAVALGAPLSGIDAEVRAWTSR